MKNYKVYSGSICIGRLKARTITSAMNKAMRTFKHSGIWVRTI